MNVQLSRTTVAAIASLWLVCAYAQDHTLAELKSKGATVLGAEELKSFLPGTTVRYENAQYATQIKFEPDGSLTGSSQHRIGATSVGQFTGRWYVTQNGRWCSVFVHTRGGESKYCRDVLKLGDKYFYAGGKPGNDERPAYEMTISK